MKNPKYFVLLESNGSGKTTTCAKLAYRLKNHGRSVILGACDTFRAAATEQLKEWGNRLDLEILVNMVLTLQRLLMMHILRVGQGGMIWFDRHCRSFAC